MGQRVRIKDKAVATAGISAALWLLVTGMSSVTVDLPAGTPAHTLQRVINSCNAALGPQRCRAAQRDGNDATWLAVVLIDGNVLEIQLFREADRSRIGYLGKRGSPVDQRRITFGKADSDSDRYVTVGLLVAALAAAQPATPVGSSTIDLPPTGATPVGPSTVGPSPLASGHNADPLRAPPPFAAPSPTAPHLGLEAALVFGPGLSRGQPRWGGALGLWWMAHDPRLGIGASLGYAASRQSIDVTWVTATGGLISQLTDWQARFQLLLSLEAIIQRANASAERDGQLQSQGVTRWGGRLGARVGVKAAAGLHPWLGGQLTLLRRAFEVRLGDEPLGTDEALGLSVMVGLTFTPFSAASPSAPSQQILTAASRAPLLSLIE